MKPKPSPAAGPADVVRRANEPALRRAVRKATAFSAPGPPPPAFAEQVKIVRAALAEAGRAADDFPVAKRVYIGIDEDAERARTRMRPALEGIYGHRVPAIEAAAVTGPAANFRVGEISQVAASGAELILFTALFDQREQMEQLAAAVLPKLG